MEFLKKELKVTKLMDCFLSCSTSHTNSIDQHTGIFKAVLPTTGLFLNQFLWYISTTVFKKVIASSLESANSSILAARRFFKEVVGEKIRILC